jgi:cytoskeleton protein RodZ
MGTFGENLRREREMRGVSLEEICDATKISMRALQAMENDQFDKLPGGIFTRSFVRTYAKYLGLDEEKIMAEFQLVAPASAQQADLNKISQQRTPPEEKSRAGPIAALIVVLVGAGGFGYYRYARRTSATSPPIAQRPAAQATPQASAPPQTPEAKPPEGVQESPVTGTTTPNAVLPAPNSQSPSATAEGGLVLQVAATEATWVAISADGKSQGQRTMQPNEIETYRAEKSFDVLTGNAEGIILTLNGKTLDPLGRQGETKKVHLTLNDVQNSNP